MPGKPLLALCAFIVVLALSFPAYRGWATEDFARETGRAEAGKTHPVSSPFHRGVRFAAGFLHLLTAVMWFGTILYVHLLPKPAYASRGLPRGGLIVG